MQNDHASIVVVDDNADIRTALKAWVGSFDAKIKVYEADSGTSCIQLLNDIQKPSAIILDIMMPGMDGWETCLAIRSNPKWKSIPIIFLTAKSDDITKEMGQFMGDYFMEKPPDQLKLKFILEKLITHGKN